MTRCSTGRRDQPIADPFAGLPRGCYRVILADPPWHFSTFSPKGQKKSASQHYDCMSVEDIAALPVRELADPSGCALFMWTTAPFLRAAFDVLEAWGFRYSTMGCWAKRTRRGGGWAIGTGYIYRGAVEPWLVGLIGKPERRHRGVRNLIDARLREHSRKPDQMRRDVERLFAGPYLELFARERAPGWDAWGNQVDRFSAPPLVQAMEVPS